MKKYEQIRCQIQSASEDIEMSVDNTKTVAEESRRVSAVARDAVVIIENIDREFERQTNLNNTDVIFLFFATALQCARQYLLTSFTESESAKESEKKAKDAEKKKFGTDGTERVDRKHQWYKPTIEEITFNPVPYDTTNGSPKMKINLGGGDHRYKTLGHDPLLGWIFGVANITTSTLTAWDFSSFHVKTRMDSLGRKKDWLTNHASTSKVLYYTRERLFQEPEAVGVAIFRQGIHIRSDEGSIKGIPFPVISSVDPKLAKMIAEKGLHLANVKTLGKQMTGAILINTVIAMIHSLLYDEAIHGARNLYEVRTRKILMYSNVIASASNVIQVALRSYLGDGNALRSLDIGGFIVTLYRIVSDVKFINQVKREFLSKQFYDVVMGEEYNF